MIREKTKTKWLWAVYLPVSVFYMELIVRFATGTAFTLSGAVYTLLFSLACGAALTLIAALGKAGFFRVCTAVWLLLLLVLMGTQTVYHHIFKCFLGLGMTAVAEDAIAGFWRDTLKGIWECLPFLLLLAVPAVLWLIFKKRLSPDSFGKKPRLILLAAFVVLQVGTTVGVTNDNSGIMSPSYMYSYKGFMPDTAAGHFGVVTTLRLDLKQLLISDAPEGTMQEIEEISDIISGEEEPASEPAPEPTPEPVVYGPHVLEIDFDSLIENAPNDTIRNMHLYFSQAEPSYENEYTGCFEGKNLIWIVAEAFSSWAVDEELTPTLYKMANSGFVFSNFYCPLWGSSTTGGEFVTLTGLISPHSSQMLARSATKYMPYGFGNLMAPLGYSSYAYHDGAYDYYGRDKSHPNLGYDYKGIGNGLQLDEPYIWPQSDLDMIIHTCDEYIDSQPFNVYYMTISGHMNYLFGGGNAMVTKHAQEVEGLPYTLHARGYKAANIELDLAMEELLRRLDEAGILEDTVIVMSADHYPYGLEISDIESMYGGDIDENFELHHSTLILYNAGMEEPVYIDKPCSSLDVMPTLANLFGLDFDSRLVMGRDILSDTPGFVVFGNHSFISEYGSYNASTNTFTPAEGVEVDDDYARQTLDKVNDMFKYSVAVIDNDYYSYVLKNDSE